MTRLIKIILLSLVSIFLFLNIFYQFRYETYLKKQKNKYGILKNKKRLKYRPAIISRMEFLLNRNKGDLSIGAHAIMYEELNLKSFTSSIILDKYIVDCYYIRDEKIQFICKNNSQYIETNPLLDLNCSPDPAGTSGIAR